MSCYVVVNVFHSTYLGWHWRSVLLFMVFSQTFFVGARCLPAQDTSAEKAHISSEAAELYRRMHEQGSIAYKDAAGDYVLRRFNHVADNQLSNQLSAVRKGLEEAKKIRIANETALGRTIDEAAMDAEIEQNLVQMEAKLSTDGWETFAIKYLIKDGSYRIEKMPLPNDVPLEKLAEQQSSPDVDSFVPTYIQAWNGELYSEMVMPESDGSTDVKEREGTSMLTEPKDAAQSFAALAYDDKGTFPKFIQYARSEAARSSFLEDMANKGCPATTVETETPEGKAITLRLGHPNSVGLKAEYVVLPEKGYCVYSSQMKFANVVRMQAEYRNFIRTSAGFWVPTHISIETFDLDEKTAVPYLSVKEELVAFENPQTNLGLEDELFDLTSDERWDKLQKSNYLLPQGDPYLDVSGIDNPGSNDRGAAPRGKKTLKRVD